MVLSTSQPSSYPVLSTGPARCGPQPPPGGGALPPASHCDLQRAP